MLSAFPNPFSNQTTLEFALDKQDHVEMNVRDLSGRNLRQLFSGVLSAGSHEVDITTEGISPGVYICELKTSMGIATVKLIVQ